MTFAIPHSQSGLTVRFSAMANQIHAHFRARLAERQRRYRIARELDACSDRELGELGFSRADLRDIVFGTYQR